MEYHSHITYIAAMSLLIGLAFSVGAPGWRVLHSVTLGALFILVGAVVAGCIFAVFLFALEATVFVPVIGILYLILENFGLTKTLAKIGSKAMWGLLVCTNVVVVYWWGPLGFQGASSDPLSTAWTSVVQVIVASAAPLLWLIMWVENLITYHKVKDKVASVLTAIG
jgi:hypothetical protein